MNTISFIKKLALVVGVIFLVSCDKDFNTIGGDIVDDNNFNFEKYTGLTLNAYNQSLGPVQTNNLPLNALGIYNNPAFGKTTASFVTQLELATQDPDLGGDVATVVVESVQLYVPYFQTLKATAATGDNTYELDSIYGSSKINLEIFESTYFLRDFDPEGGFQDPQKYFSNESDQGSNFNANHNALKLNDSDVPSQNTEFVFSPLEYVSTDSDGKTVRTVPGMKLDLNKAFFKTKIFNAPTGQLVNNNIFKNYFRGLYFKVSASAANPNGGALNLMDFSKGTITIKYKITKEGVVSDKSLVLNTKGNSVNLLNTTPTPEYTAAVADPNSERLYVKGGEGTATFIDLFSAEELADIRGKGWLINDANLVFYVDKTAMTGADEPQRVYLYDARNSKPLMDYYLDASTNAKFAKLNKGVFDGIAQKETGTNGRTIKYRVRLTEHIKHLISNDTVKNVKLGLVITENINTITNAFIKNPITTPAGQIKRVPMVSIINPLGTVMYSNHTTPANESKKLKLEIYYTKPN